MKQFSFRRFARKLGPGVITGAADDDPSGITTYSMAGAQFGMAFLWMALLAWPLMAAVQQMCARIGMVTGEGLMGALRLRFPRPVLVLAAASLFVANTLNIGADLAGMADAAEILTHVSSHVWVVGFAISITVATILLHYTVLANTLKWLALVLLAYIIVAFIVGPDWTQVARHTFIPTLPSGRSGWSMVVAILGTTISPYLFFWQASQEVEEEKSHGRKSVKDRSGATVVELADRDIDIGVGTFVSVAAMFFMMLTTALTLNAHGIINLTTSGQVARALEPLAGRFAALLYTVGLVGTGALAIPTLAGSAAYAFCELFGWRQGMDERPRNAPAFYTVLAIAVVLGMLMDFANMNALLVMYWSAVINGLLAPFLLTGILVVAADRALMKAQPSPRLARSVVALAALLMFGAAGAMFAL